MQQQLRAATSAASTSASLHGTGRTPTRSLRSCSLCHRSRRSLRVCAYDVDVEAERRSAPNSAPGGGWGAPPPPPPPPPPPRTSMQAPNRREALFGFLGTGIGAAITAAYYNTTYDLSEDSYIKALDALLDDDQFLDTVADEVVYRDYGQQLDKFGVSMDAMVDLDAELKKLQADLARLAEEQEDTPGQ